MGHDVAAAAAMGQLRSVLRSYAYEGSSPSVVLDRLDRLVQGFDMAQVATAIFGRLVRDATVATLVFTNAGHLPRSCGIVTARVDRVERGASPPIGVLEPGRRRRNEAALPLQEGSLLVLYTDGLVETREREYDAGIDELCAAPSKHSTLTKSPTRHARPSFAPSSATVKKTTSRCWWSASTPYPSQPDRHHFRRAVPHTLSGPHRATRVAGRRDGEGCPYALQAIRGVVHPPCLAHGLHDGQASPGHVQRVAPRPSGWDRRGVGHLKEHVPVSTG